MRPFTQEDEKRAMSSLKDIFDNDRAFAYYDKKVAKSEKAAKVACLSLAINDLYGCHKEVDVEQGIKWLETGIGHGSNDCRYAYAYWLSAAYEWLLHGEMAKSEFVADTATVEEVAKYIFGNDISRRKASSLIRGKIEELYRKENFQLKDAWEVWHFRSGLLQIELSAQFLRARTKAGKTFLRFLTRRKRGEMYRCDLTAAELGSALHKVNLCRGILTDKKRLPEEAVRFLNQDSLKHPDANFDNMDAIRTLMVIYEERDMVEAADCLLHYLLPLLKKHERSITEGDIDGLRLELGESEECFGPEDVARLQGDVQNILIGLAEKGRADHQHMAGVFLMDAGEQRDAVYYLKRASAQGHPDSDSFLYDILSLDINRMYKDHVLEHGDVAGSEAIGSFWAAHDALLYEGLRYGAEGVLKRRILPGEFSVRLKELENMGAVIDLTRLYGDLSERDRLKHALFAARPPRR